MGYQTVQELSRAGRLRLQLDLDRVLVGAAAADALRLRGHLRLQLLVLACGGPGGSLRSLRQLQLELVGVAVGERLLVGLQLRLPVAGLEPAPGADRAGPALARRLRLNRLQRALLALRGQRQLQPV